MKNTKNRWYPVLWMTIIFALFFTVDLLTKHFLYDADKLGQVTYENAVFGIRSFPHNNSTLFSSLDLDTPLWVRVLINLALATIVATITFFTKSVWQNIGFGIILAGILGNTVDIIFTDGNFVKDIIFTPWMDKGTFNFADMWMVLGAFVFLVASIVKGFKPEKE